MKTSSYATHASVSRRGGFVTVKMTVETALMNQATVVSDISVHPTILFCDYYKFTI